jgi:type IV pilus assembly protein PilO
MKLLDDFKNIDPNDIASWPTPVKVLAAILIAIAIGIGGYIYFIKDLRVSLERVQKKEQELRQTFLRKKALALNLPAYRAQMQEMQERFGVMLRQLPNKTEIPELLIDITQAGLGRGLQFELFQPGVKSSQDFYATLPINLKVYGSYHELGEFVSDLAALPRIVSLGNIQIQPAGRDRHKKLAMTATAMTYHYLDEEDQAAAAQDNKTARRRR